MQVLEFVIFRFYRRRVVGADNVVYRCERVKDDRALLQVSNMRTFFRGYDRRIVLGKRLTEEWELIPPLEEFHHILTYHRDLHKEYHSNYSDEAMRSAVFRRQYYLDPYLADLADEEIEKRMEAISDNLYRFCINGEPILLTGEELWIWQRKADEVLEELGNDREHFLEEHPEIPGTKVMHLVLSTTKNNNYANQIPWGKLPQPSGGQLFKFGEDQYLRPALDQGRIRITSTSFYGNSMHNSARRDSDEGRTILRPSRTGLKIFIKDAADNTIFGPVERGDSQLALHIGGDQDFFIWCCSRVYEPRLYVDFQANSCLVIHDAREFSKRVNAGLLQIFPDLPRMKGSHVRYYDPFVPEDTLDEMLKTPMSLFLFKDLKYAYQKEYRLLWPTDGKQNTPYVDIEVGPLSDICELLVLPIREG